MPMKPTRPNLELPIDPILPSIVEAVRSRGVVVLEAPPGAGKTTRVPLALLEAGLAGAGELIVLEPRRLAARLAAVRIASELGEAVGETVGYQVRYEDVSGPKTRLKFVTEGILVRRLIAEPSLPGVGAVVLDEFHERHLHADLALALLRRIREDRRPVLRLAVMSATLDADPVAAWLDAPIVRAEGRRYEVSVEYLEPSEAADPGVRDEARVARALRKLIAEGNVGNILVFLPGMSEIRRAMDACADIAGKAGYDLLPLHGSLSPEAQDRAILPGLRPKAIFSTNVAETSVTIEGVTAVIDSGLARIASHSPWSGLPRLELRKISRASAAQRAGRAGRTAPGRVIRLYTRFDHDMRPANDLPEIAREDLAETVLVSAALGVADLAWLDPPPRVAWESAVSLLKTLGALDPVGEITRLGREMIRFPLHPRLSALVVEAHARGAGREGALAAALVAEMDIRERGTNVRNGRRAVNGNSDLIERVHLFREAERSRFFPERLRSLGLSSVAVAQVDRARGQIAGHLRDASAGPDTLSPENADEVLMGATLASFSDRLGRRREPGSDEIVLAAGGTARLSQESVVGAATLLVAVDVEESRGGATIRMASAVTPEMLLDRFPDRLKWEEASIWNESAGRVEGWEKLTFDAFVLESSRLGRVDPQRASELLAGAARAKGNRAFAPAGAVDRLLARMAYVSNAFPDSGLVPFSEEALDGVLKKLCEGRRSFAELEAANLSQAVASMLAPDRRAFLDRMAPERIALPGGRMVMVQYDPDGKAPYLECRIQDFFGANSGPAIGEGRTPLVLHLLAPNMRAVQMTSDLAGFWERHYPAIRKELMRRYPKHAWPDRPRDAAPAPAAGRHRQSKGK